MSEVFPVGTKVRTDEGSDLRRKMGKYGVVTKFDPNTNLYTLRPARSFGESYPTPSTNFRLLEADEVFPTDATALAVVANVERMRGGRRKIRRATKKARKNRRATKKARKNL